MRVFGCQARARNESERRWEPARVHHRPILMSSAEAPVNGGRNYNGPKVAKFLVGSVPTCTNGVTI